MAVIEVRHLHKRYVDQVAVKDVSFEVGKGEIFGIIGPNGAGRTTTVELWPRSGRSPSAGVGPHPARRARPGRRRGRHAPALAHAVSVSV
jgi:ABC-type uncharacterized transport system ATPase subunit